MKRLALVTVCFVLLFSTVRLIVPASVIQNPISTTFTGIDGRQVTSDANGKPKMLVFFKRPCYNCQETLSILSKPELNRSAIDIAAVAIDDSSSDEIQSFVAENGYEGIEFCYGSNCHQVMWRYIRELLGSDVNSIITPFVVVLNAANEVVYYNYGLNNDILEDVSSALGVSIINEACPESHTPGKIKRTVYSYPTAEKYGWYKRVQYCSECGHIISDQNLPFYQYGDIDRNGQVNSDDLTLLAKIIAKIEPMNVNAEIMADTNHDMQVNSDDLTRLAQYIARIISEL